MTNTPLTSPDADIDISHRELLHRVYAFFYNKGFGLFLILATAVMSLLGVLFSQAPDEALADPAVYASWLDSLRPKYRGWTGILNALGIFRMFTSWPFRIIIVLLVLSIIACTLHRLPTLWRNATAPHTSVRESLFDRARTHRTVLLDGSPEQAREQVQAALGQRGYRLIDSSDAEHGVNLYADKFRFCPLGTALAHTAFCLILLGCLVTANFGFEDKNFVVPVGAGPVEVGHGTGLSVEAKSFTDSYNKDGRPMDYASDLVLYQDGQQVKQQIVRVNSPLKHDGVTFNQASFGFAAQVTVTDAKGAPVWSGSVPLQYASEDQSKVFGFTDLPDSDLQLYVVSNASGQVSTDLAAGQVLVQLYRDGQQQTAVASEVADQGKEKGLGNYLVTFERERQYTSLMASRDYGAPLVWTGSILLMLGTFFTMFLRHKRLWLRFHPTDDGGTRMRLACPDRHDVSFERSIDTLLTELDARPESLSGATAASPKTGK